MIDINKHTLTEKEQNTIQLFNELINEDNLPPNIIAQRSQLSLATVSRVLNELQEKNLIEISGLEKNGKGRRPKQYSYNKKYGYLLHFSFEMGAVRAYIANLGGNVIASEIRHFAKDAPPGEIFKIISLLSEQMCDNPQVPGRLLAAGFSIPGVVIDGGRKIYEVIDIPTLNDVNIYDYVSKLFGVPVVINNIAWNSVIGEKYENYHFADNIAYLNMCSTKGVGLGLIIGSKLVRGGNCFAGEAGLSFYDYDVSFEEYEQGKGHLEDSMSVYTLYTTLKQKMDEGGASILKGILGDRPDDSISISDVESAIQKGDSEVEQIYSKILKLLAMLLTNINYLVNPDFIIIGGEYTAENQFSLKLLNEYVSRLGYFKPALRLSTLGKQAELIGGISILKEQIFNSTILSEVIRKHRPDGQ